MEPNLLDDAAARFADVLRTGDLAAPVPCCGGWRLLDLAHHLGGVHRWARIAVVEGREGPEPPDGGPSERGELVGWFAEGASALVAALTEAGPDAPCWTFGAGPHVAGFWTRRQIHETAVHAYDAECSQGAPGPLADDLARDGIDEVVTMFAPRQVRLGRTVLPSARLALAVPGGPRWEIAGDSAVPEAVPDAVVHGPAEALYLLVWRRIGPDDERLRIDGDRAAAAAVLDAGLTP